MLAGAALLLLARGASADKQATNFLAPGALITYTGHVDQPALGGIGGEVTFMRYPWTPYYGGLGAFAQLQSVGLDHARGAIGAQASIFFFGGELGAFIEEASKDRATTIGIQATPFLSIGFFSIGFRMGIPLMTLSKGPIYAVDLGMALTLKWAIPLDGSYISFHG